MNKQFMVPGFRLGTLVLYAVLILCSFTIYSQQSVKQALISSNEIQRKAHLENDAALLVSQIADEMISVDNGEISRLSNDQVKERFEGYFKLVKYTTWDDLQEPIIRVSDDQTLAVVIVQKLIDLQYRNEEGNLGDHQYAQFAWEAQYRNIDGQWKIVSITSTDKELSAEEAEEMKLWIY